MYIYIYIYIYIDIYRYIYICIDRCTYMHIYTYVYENISIHICICIGGVAHALHRRVRHTPRHPHGAPPGSYHTKCLEGRFAKVNSSTNMSTHS